MSHDNHGPCPSCGYCRCCGRGAQPIRFVPVWPYTIPPTTITFAGINPHEYGVVGANAGCAPGLDPNVQVFTSTFTASHWNGAGVLS